MPTARLLVFAITLLVFSGCGSSRTVVDHRGDGGVHTRVLSVKPAPNQTGLQVPQEYQDLFAKSLERVVYRSAFSRGTDGVTLTYTFTDGDAGSRSARFWWGFGAGAGSIVVTAIWTDAAGKEIARTTHSATVTGGTTGGSWAEAFERCANEVGTYARKTFLERQP